MRVAEAAAASLPMRPPQSSSISRRRVRRALAVGGDRRLPAPSPRSARRREATACPSAVYAAEERTGESSAEARRPRKRDALRPQSTNFRRSLTETAAAPLALSTSSTTTTSSPSTSASTSREDSTATASTSEPNAPSPQGLALSLRRRLLLRPTSASHPSAAAAAAHSKLLAASLGLLSALADAPEALAATTTAATAAAATAAASAAAAATVTAATAATSTFLVAEGGPLPPALLEALSSFLAAVEDMGPAGAGVFAATVALAELVPLLPTTPLALASGLLFGAAKGASLVIAGNLVAATAAFYIARGVGARFARRVVAAEGGHSDDERASPSPAAGLAARFASVTAAIEKGTAAQKFAAVFALRATPVVPFSASNYVLGLSPISFPVYFAATALGGSIWASVYASLGAASRALLARGAAIDVLVADLLEQATSVADDTATGLVLLSVGAAAGWGLALAAKSRGGKEGEGEEVGETERQEPRSKANGAKGGSSRSASSKGLEALK